MKKNNLYIKFEKYFEELKSRDCSFLYDKFKDILEKAHPFIINNRENLTKVSIPLVIIALGFYACTGSQKRIKRNIDDIFRISDEIRLHYAQKADYWGLNSSYVIDSKILAPKYIKNDNIVLADGKILFIGKGNDGKAILPRANEFDMALNDLNNPECIAYLETALTETNLMKLVNVEVINSKGSFKFGWGDKTYSLPIKKHTVKTVCDDKNNAIIWTVR
ncbi:MAG: hypothetical protein IKW58_02890 [Alphaproteobacteria bacterium]|nr:hypothetical protein [Alphaproteobacteria bacterium]